jgi:hypothetical protein
MKGRLFEIDERSQSIIRRIGAGLYFLTIAALWVDIFYRHFILKQPISQFQDIAAIMTANVLLFVAAVLYYGGVTIRRVRPLVVLLVYAVFVAAGTAFTAVRQGITSPGALFGQFIIVAAICAILVILYLIAIYLGSRKVEKELDE